MVWQPIYLSPLPLWVEGSQPWLHLLTNVSGEKWGEKKERYFIGEKKQKISKQTIASVQSVGSVLEKMH